MKNPKRKSVALTAIILAAVMGMFATAPAMADVDYSGVTSVVSSGPLLLAITAVAAIKMAPGVAKWGFNKLIGWFR